MFLGGGSQKSSLVERLSEEQKPPRVNMGAAARALEKATGTKDISIKGASVRGNLIEVKGLVAGTTADDVEVSPFNLPLTFQGEVLTIRDTGNLQALWTHRKELRTVTRAYRWYSRRSARVQGGEGRAICCQEVQWGDC